MTKEEIKALIPGDIIVNKKHADERYYVIKPEGLTVAEDTLILVAPAEISVPSRNEIRLINTTCYKIIKQYGVKHANSDETMESEEYIPLLVIGYDE